MLIFIDESGVFQIPRNRPNRVSCISALVIPEKVASTLLRQSRRLIRSWNLPGEPKGSQLNEQQMSEVFQLLNQFDATIFATAIDMGLHTEGPITQHKEQQANLIATIPLETHPNVRQWLETRAANMRTMPNQLYVQATLLNMLVEDIFRHGSLYYVQRDPSTLYPFSWRIDAKHDSRTIYEMLWTDMVGPYMQSVSLSKPMLQLEGADYSRLELYARTEERPPDYLAPHAKTWAEGKPFRYFVMNDLLTKKLKFSNSAKYTGLQLVDFIASAISRACNGNLQEPGWIQLGNNLIQTGKRSTSLHFFAFPGVQLRQKVPYASTVNKLSARRKNMIPATA